MDWGSRANGLPRILSAGPAGRVGLAPGRSELPDGASARVPVLGRRLYREDLGG